MGIRELPKVGDEHLASYLGSLYADGAISLVEYDAGSKYASIILNYLKTIDAPSPYSSDRCESFSDEICLKRKMDMATAREILKGISHECMRVVDRVAVYGEPVYSDDLPHLRKGLRALAGT